MNDEQRRVIYVLKHQKELTSHYAAFVHRYPGELRWDRKDEVDELVVDVHSLEAYSGLLGPGREVFPARVLLQLFWENTFEMAMNQWLVKKINSLFSGRIKLTATSFSLSEIGSTLKTAFGAGNPGSAFNLSIHTVDEWWLGRNQRRSSPAPLRRPRSPGSRAL